MLKHHCMISPMKTTKPNTFRYIHLCSFYSFSLLFCCLACILQKTELLPRSTNLFSKGFYTAYFFMQRCLPLLHLCQNTEKGRIAIFINWGSYQNCQGGRREGLSWSIIYPWGQTWTKVQSCQRCAGRNGISDRWRIIPVKGWGD